MPVLTSVPALTKEGLVRKLEELGFEAAIIDGLPYFLDAPFETAEKIIKALDYKSSWGVMLHEIKTIKEVVE